MVMASAEVETPFRFRGHVSWLETRRSATMEIATEELPGGITHVILTGSLDIAGAAAIDLRMNVIAGSHKAVLVDLRQVSFIGSMGLSALVAPARAGAARWRSSAPMRWLRRCSRPAPLTRSSLSITT